MFIPKTSVARLSAAFLAASAAASASAAFDPSASGLSLYWRFGETGAAPTAADATGNGRDGTAHGNVKGCGGGGTNVKSYGGFTSIDSFVAIDKAKNTDSGKWFNKWTVVAWVRNPDLTSTSPHIIARGANKDFDYGVNKDNAWDLRLDTDGKVVVCFRAGGVYEQSDAAAAADVDWADGQWRQVALVFSQTSARNAENVLMYTRTANVYVTPAGAEAVGAPVLTYSATSKNSIVGGTGGATDGIATALLIGAARKGYSTGHPAGYFNGEIRDVSVWTKNLTPADLLADVKTFKEDWHDIDDFALLHWKMDGSGARPTATDSTAHALDGVSQGNVTGTPGVKPPYFRGFTSTDSCVEATLPIQFGNTSEISPLKQSDVLMLVRNPALETGSKAILARGSYWTSEAAPQLRIPWQAWVDEDGSVCVGTQDFGSQIVFGEAGAFTWERNKWYLVLIRRDCLAAEQDRVRVYVAKAGSASLGEPVASVTSNRRIATNADESLFSVGGGETGGRAWSGDNNGKTLPGGSWGGQIADVSFVSGGHYDDAFLRALLKAWDYGAPGLTVLVR